MLTSIRFDALEDNSRCKGSGKDGDGERLVRTPVPLPFGQCRTVAQHGGGLMHAVSVFLFDTMPLSLVGVRGKFQKASGRYYCTQCLTSGSDWLVLCCPRGV